MFKKNSIKFNGFTAQSPSVELPIGEQDANDPLTLTWSKPQSTAPDAYFVRITNFDLTDVRLLNPSEKKKGAHGSVSSAVTETNRFIRIDGEICASGRQGQNNGWQTLNRIFSPPNFPSILNRGMFRLEMDDYNGDTWFLYAQIERNLARLRIDPQQPFVTPFSVLLRAEDVSIFSDEVFTGEFPEGDIGGMAVGESAGGGVGTLTPSAISGLSEVINGGNNVSPTKVTIQKNDGVVAFDSPFLASNPRITNLNSNKYFKVNIDMELGDILEIDGVLSEIRVNGVVSNNLKVIGSKFLYLLGGGNDLVLSDDTHSSLYGKNIKATVEFRKVLK